MNYTTIEQSKRLLELGLDPETADMCYEYQTDKWVGEPDYRDYPVISHATHKKDIPCWSMTALENSLPNLLDISTCISTYSGNKTWTYALENNKSRSGLRIFNSKDRMETLLEAICWDLKNNYI